VLLLEHPLAIGVEGERCARERPGDAGDHLRGLLQVGEHALGGEEVRPRAVPDGRHPVLVQHRGRQHPAAAGIGEEPAPQLDRVRQVQIEPVSLAGNDPLEPGVQPSPDLYHGAARVGGEEIADPAIEDHRAQDGDPAAPAPAVFLRVEVNRRQDLRCPGIPEHRPFLAGLPGARRQRDEQGLLDRPELRLDAVCHPRHYTPAALRSGTGGQDRSGPGSLPG